MDVNVNIQSHSVKTANAKRRSTVLVIKEMQIKLRCHFLPINLAKIFLMIIPTAGEDVKKRGPLMPCLVGV